MQKEQVKPPILPPLGKGFMQILASNFGFARCEIFSSSDRGQLLLTQLGMAGLWGLGARGIRRIIRMRSISLNEMNDDEDAREQQIKEAQGRQSERMLIA